MSPTRHPARLTAALITIVLGCQSRLNVEQTYRLEPGTLQDVEIDAPRYDQKMAVTVTSDNPVNVYVYLQKDSSAVRSALDKGKKPDAVLMAKESVQAENLEVSVPAKEKAVITIEAMTKAASVKVTVVGK